MAIYWCIFASNVFLSPNVYIYIKQIDNLQENTSLQAKIDEYVCTLRQMPIYLYQSIDRGTKEITANV